jgi:hypothetical protein
MTDEDLIQRYNYDSFVHDKFMPWMRFETSPPLGEPAPDFPLWDLEGEEIPLISLWDKHLYTIVEFGSYT